MTAEIQAKVAGALKYSVVRVLSEAELGRLAGEARACMSKATLYRSLAPTPDGQGGGLEGWLDTAEGGPLLDAFIRSPRLAAAMLRLTGQHWAPREPQNKSRRFRFSYYRAPGHYAGLHRDQAACQLSLIACVDDQPGEGGELLLYPGRNAEPLSAIRAAPEAGCVRLRLQPGESVVAFATEIPHCVTPVGAGRTRITAAHCYLRCG